MKLMKKKKKKTTIDMKNQKKIIERLIKDNARFYKDLKVLRII